MHDLLWVCVLNHWKMNWKTKSWSTVTFYVNRIWGYVNANMCELPTFASKLAEIAQSGEWLGRADTRLEKHPPQNVVNATRFSHLRREVRWCVSLYKRETSLLLPTFWLNTKQIKLICDTSFSNFISRHKCDVCGMN